MNQFVLKSCFRFAIVAGFAFVVSLASVCNAAPTASAASNIATVAGMSTAATAACPFCSAVSLTLTEQMESKDVVVSVRLLEIPEPADDAEELPKAKFEVIKVLRGKEFLKSGMKFEAMLIGKHPVGQKFFVMGVDPPQINWTTPMKSTDRLLTYLEKLPDLPKSGADRLAFFQDYFEDKESTLAFDAYDEFAKAPYEDLLELKDRMNREKFIEFIKNPKTSVNRRRLYLTLLGVCGEKKDAEFLEKLISSGSRKEMRGLDALVACFLNLKGDSGIELIEELFLANPKCEYTETMQAVSALRFHGTETDVLSKDLIVAAVRNVLDRKDMADMIVPDLARWEDWSVMDRLVKMFKESSDEDNWIRVPVVSYLHACPKPEAKAYIEELRKIDPNSVARAEFFITGLDDDDEDDDEETEETESPENTESETAEPAGSGGKVLPNESVNVSIGDKVEFVALNETTSAQESEKHVVQRVSQIATSSHNTQVTAGSQASEDQETFAISKDSDSIPELANQATGTFVVSKPADSQSIQSSSSNEQMAQVPLPIQPEAVAPVAAAVPNLTWYIIFVPMVISVGILMLLWSVVSGWFERLIF